MNSLGLITVPTPGTPVALTAEVLHCVRISFQPMKASAASNAGKIFVGKVGMNKTTLAGVVLVMDPDQPATTLEAPTGGDLAGDYWLDAETADDGALVAYA